VKVLRLVFSFSIAMFLVGCAAKEEMNTSLYKKEVSILSAQREQKETIAEEFYKKLKLEKPKSVEKTKLHEFGYMYFNKEEK